MKINQQLFEDILSGKLKGTFVLRNGTKINTSNFKKNVNGCNNIYPYRTNDYSYTAYGDAYVNSMSSYDIINFIPDMKQNELTIKIPDGKIVDWDESKKQNKIVLKDKQLTYEDICDELYENKTKIVYFITKGDIGKIRSSELNKEEYYDSDNATTEHQLECILAKNKLATVAMYLNNGWKPSKTDLGYFDSWVLYTTPNKDYIGWVKIYNRSQNGNVLFKSKELAEQAIEILGEETVKLALEPLGI